MARLGIRRFGVALMVAFMVATSFSHVTAPPTNAVIANPITADAGGDLVEHFEADDALFAYFTVDITGGDICIVNESTVPAPGMNCESGVAWGSPNHFVGLGLQHQGLEAPFLTIGTWRLLAASTPTSANPNPTPSLSAPFTVGPCVGTCDTTIGQAAIDAWKASAGQATEGGYLACQAMAVQSTVSAATGVADQVSTMRGILYDVANIPKKGIRVGLRTSLAVAVDFSAGLITLPMPDFSASEEMAMALLKQLLCSAALMHETIKLDPPDPNFTTVAQPVFTDVPNPVSEEGQALGVSLDRQRALGEAMLHAFERYLGASDANEPQYVALQAQAMSDFGLQAAQEMRTSARLLRDYVPNLGDDPAVVDPVVADQAALDRLVATQTRIRDDGFLPEEVAELTDEGFTAAEVTQIRAMFDLDFTDFPVGVPIDTIIEDVADDFEEAAVDYDAIAREASSVAAIADPNLDPSAADDTASTPVNTPVDVLVLNNDSDPDGHSLTVTGSTTPEHGTATCDSDSCQYIPAPDYTGADSFGYTVSDGHGGTATATVSITVTPGADGNLPPVAVDDELTVTVNKSGATHVIGNDSDPDFDPLSITLRTGASHGVAQCFTSGTCLYTPAADYVGPDTFEYTVSDGRGGIDVGLVNVTVAPNLDPTAVDDVLTTRENAPSPRSVSVTANDSDPDGDPLTVISNTDPAHGTAEC